jgi:CheY-like chemotaxis protein
MAMRILFVDDLPDTRELFKIALSLHGHTVHLASNGLEAVAAVENQQAFNVIIMDIEMPEMNGWDAVRAIRALPAGEGVPIIMFTAYGNGVTLTLAQQVGANSVLHKPISPQDLISHVHQIAA